MRRIGITLGDPSGVGPEVALSALSKIDRTRFIPVLIGRSAVVERVRSVFPACNLIPFDEKNLPTENKSASIFMADLPSNEKIPEPGKGSIDTARESLRYIDESIRLWKNGSIDGVVTGPVHKGNIEKSGTPFIGHTEYYAHAVGGEPFMMMFSPEYRILLVTTHLPVVDLPSRITVNEIMRTIVAGNDALRAIDGKAPRIAITGFDPHCGDDGAIGDFDAKITRVAVERARALSINIEGPYSADTLFIPAKWKQFDLVIAHYHDQGLIPFKMTAFSLGVNVTLGLPIVRTSVDHGTAFDIAGQGIADSSSMCEAIRLAERLIEIRSNQH